MYSIVYINKNIKVIPAECVQSTFKTIAFGIATKKRAYEILHKILIKQNKNKIK